MITKSDIKLKTKNGIQYFYKRIELGRNPIDGKRIQKEFYSRDAKELIKKVNEYLALKNQHIDPDSKETFGQFMNYWLINVKFMATLKNSTKERYLGIFNNYIINPEKFLTSNKKTIVNSHKLQIANIPMLKIDMRCLQDYYNALYMSGVTVSTLESINKLLSPCIKYAYVNNTIVKDFSVGLTIPNHKQERKRKKEAKNDPKNFFSSEEKKIFLESIKDNREKLLYRIGFSLGLRLGELLGLRWSDIDLDEGTLTISTSVRREKDPITGISQLVLTSLKTDSSYSTLYIPSFLIPEIKDHKLKQDKEKELASNLYINNSLVFATEFGKIIEPSNIRKRYKKLLLSASLPNKTLHALRHTCATNLMELNLNSKEIKYIMRHADESITEGYIHISDERKREIANIITL